MARRLRFRRIRRRVQNILFTVPTFLLRLTQNPFAIATILVSIIILSQSKTDSTSLLNIIRSATSNSKIPFIKKLGAWMYDNDQKTVASIFTTGTIIAEVPSKFSPGVLVGFYIFIYFIKLLPLWDYVLFNLAIVCYFKFRKLAYKYLILATGFFLILIGYFS